MVFVMNVDLKNIVGTPQNLYENNKDIKRIYNTFRRGYINSFSLDPINQRTMFSSPVLRSIQTFIRDYGADDANKIIDFVFDEWNGRYKGNPLGTKIFSKKFRWLTDMALTEISTKESEEDLWL